jgi:hypothetical protein
VISPRSTLALAATTMLFSVCAASVEAQFVPGRGTLMTTDDFENPEWGFNFNLPKSSKEEDEQIRYPLGLSTNNRWKEGPKRGVPDIVKVVETPYGGLPHSRYALLIRSKETGIPGRPSFTQKQDDLVMVSNSMSVANSPSVVTRVYLPDWDEWERRAGVSFGIRIGLQGPMKKPAEDGRLFRRGRTVTVTEPYYPGFFIQFNPRETSRDGRDSATLIIRANEYGQDLPHLQITQTGWWTFGMSVTPDARVHYYARPGVEGLTEADYLTSSLPYGIVGTHFNTLFFNICSGDDGRTWSTPWIIDDPQIFYGQTPQLPATQTAQQRGTGAGAQGTAPQTAEQPRRIDRPGYNR